ncbi:MAG: c-type cytochrome [Polyangiaceae bacterium]
MKKTVGYLFACGALVALLGCGKSASPDSNVSDKTGADTPSAKSATTGGVDPKELFQSRCVACHGATGHGDGPGAVALNPKPRNYTDPAWQDKVTDEDIRKTILYGGAAVGKSPNMPANPDLDGKPELDGLVKVVRAFKGK